MMGLPRALRRDPAEMAPDGRGAAEKVQAGRRCRLEGVLRSRRRARIQEGAM